LAALKPIIDRTQILLPNETELKLLTGKDYKSGAKALIKEGLKILAVKLGEKGCYVTDGEEKHLIKPSKLKWWIQQEQEMPSTLVFSMA